MVGPAQPPRRPSDLKGIQTTTQESRPSDFEKALLLIVLGVVVLALLTPLIVMAPPLPSTFFPYVVGKAVYSRAIIEVAVGMWLLLAIRYPAYRPARSWLLLALFVFLLITLLASLYGVSPQRSLWSTYERMQGFVDLAHWFAFVVVLTSVFKTWLAWRLLLNFNLLVSVVMGLLGLAELNDWKVLSYLSYEGRIEITLGNSTYVGAYMLVNIMIALGFLGYSFLKPPAQQVMPRARARESRRRRSRRRTTETGREDYAIWGLRAAWVFVVLLDTFILWKSGTRGAIVGLGAGLLAFAVGYIIWGRLRYLRVGALALIGTVLALVMVFVLVKDTAAFHRLSSSSAVLSRLATVGPDDASVRGRLDSMYLGIKGAAERPLLGWGPENFTIAYDRNVTGDIASRTTQSFDQAHNKLIEELTTKGSLGFLSYIAIWLVMLWAVGRRVKQQSPHDQVITIAAGAALVAYFVQNLFLFDTPGTVGQFYLLVGFVVYTEISTTFKGELRAETEEQAAGPVTGRQQRRPYRLSGILRTGMATVLRPPVTADPGGRSDKVESPTWFLVQLWTTLALALAIGLLLNYGPYKGARTVIQTVGQSITWQERLDIFDEAIAAFPPLANYPRIVMFNQLSSNWSALSDEEKKAALEVVQREGLEGMRSEPEEWRIYATLAGVYQSAAFTNPFHVETARSLVDAVAELAPERLNTLRLVVRQYIIEEDFAGAAEVLDAYIEKYPEAATHLQGVRDEVAGHIERTAGS